MENATKDKRFTHIVNDPKFKRLPKNKRKVNIDKRFQSMFEDKNFASCDTVDKRGKPTTQSSGDNLRKYYYLSESEDEISPIDNSKQSEETVLTNKIGNKEKINNESFPSKNLLIEIKNEEMYSYGNLEEKNQNQLYLKNKNKSVELSQNIKRKLKDLTVDYARGEGLLVSDSSSDESLSEFDSDEGISHNWGELDKEAEVTNITTHRLAACNMDWDNMRAVDLMVSLHSFLPSEGRIHSVTIYPSEFGLKRLEEEEMNGPIELVNGGSDVINMEDEEGSSYHMEKLRQYQLNRLKYYYAVIVFDSPETADKVWNECRNFEYESSGIRYDLRFIPEDMVFDQEPREVSTMLPDFSTYQPRIFTTTALQQEKVNLTWDDTNPKRKEIARKLNSGIYEELSENHLQYLLASGTSEDESDDSPGLDKKNNGSKTEIKENTNEKYRLLLDGIQKKGDTKKKNDLDLECTWGLNVKASSDDSRKRKIEQRTQFQEFLEKQKGKREAKRKRTVVDQIDQDDALPRTEVQTLPNVVMDDPYFVDELKSCTSRMGKKKCFEMYTDAKNKNDKEERNAELELISIDSNECEHKRHFNMEKIVREESFSKSRRKRLEREIENCHEKRNDDFRINLHDPRFDALFTSHNFNIDPTDSHFKRTKAIEAFVTEKLRRSRIKKISRDSKIFLQ